MTPRHLLSFFVPLCLGCGDDSGTGGGATATTGATAQGPTTGITSTQATSTATGASTGTGMQAGWTTLPPLPGGPRQETAVVARGQEVLVLGGFDENGMVVDDVEIFDATTGAWSDGPALPTPMHHANAAVVGDTVFVVGYLEGLGFTAHEDCFSLRPGETSWDICMAMATSERRGASAIGVSGTEILVAGGFRGQAVADASVFDTSTDSWSPLPPLPTPTDHLVGGVVDGRFFAIGGRDTDITAFHGAVLELAPDRASWIARAMMPTARGGAAAAVFGGRIYVFGGEGNAGAPSGVFADVEAYDPTADSWMALAPMKTPRHGTGAAAVIDRILVPGGATTQAFGAVDTVESFVPQGQ